MRQGGRNAWRGFRNNECAEYRNTGTTGWDKLSVAPFPLDANQRRTFAEPGCTLSGLASGWLATGSRTTGLGRLPLWELADCDRNEHLASTYRGQAVLASASV